MKIIKELTPERFKCGPIANCPAVYKTDEGTLVIGKELNSASLPSEVRAKVHSDEKAILVPEGLFAETDK